MKTESEMNINKMGFALALAVMMSGVVAISVPSAAMAFPDGGCRGGDAKIERMAERLNLNEKQQQQMKQIHRDRRAEGMALRDAMQDNRDAMRKLDPGQKDYQKAVKKLAAEKGDLVRLMAIHRAEAKAEVYALLTPEQREQAKQLKQERGDRRFNRDGERPGGDRRGPGDGERGPGWM